jgi:large conductance mechanosensitive channel
MSGLLGEFKTFIMKGNVIDLATAVIVGGAFGKIVTSFVNDIMMPPIGLILGNVNFKDLKYILKAARMEGDKEIAAITLNYGQFIQNIFDFLIIAFCIFMVLQFMKDMQKKPAPAAAAPPAPPKPTREEELLTEIRDLLKNK